MLSHHLMNCKPTFVNKCLKENVIIMMMMMMIMVIEKHAKSVSATSSSGVT